MNNEITVTLTLEEYKDLVVAKTRLDFEARIVELEKLLEAERENSTYWYDRAKELGKAVNDMKDKLSFYEPVKEGGEAENG